MKVKCDKCGEIFRAQPVKVKQRVKKYNVTLAQFRCRHCNKVYKSFLYTDELKELINKKEELLIQARTEVDEEKWETLRERSNNLRDEIYQRHAELQEEIAEVINIVE